MRQSVMRAVGLAALALAAACGTQTAAVMDPATTPSASASFATALPQPPIESCQALGMGACYSAVQLRTAYGVDRLNQAGTTGKGQTIGIFDLTGSPTARADLEAFSQANGLPQPQLQIIKHRLAGEIDPFDPGDPDDLDAAQETTLDLQAAHAMAPDAQLILIQVDLPDDAPVGPRQRAQEEGDEAVAAVIADAVEQLVTQTDTDVISISYGISEYQLDAGGKADLRRLHRVFELAAAEGVTVLAATGDSGAARRKADGTYQRYVNWPASDPAVVAVGGTHLKLDQQGKRTAPDTVWHQDGGATGGGVSDIFARPAYQEPVVTTVGSRRGLPDLSMSANPDGGLLIYQSMDGNPAWMPIGGTSEAAPLLAGVVALAGQQAGGALGPVNAAIYQLAQAGTASGVVDVTQGVNGPDGYRAVPGYDLASGWGTIDAPTFVPALAKAAAVTPSPTPTR